MKQINNQCAAKSRQLQKRTGRIIGSPEKVAYKQGFINKEQLQKQAEALKKSGYGKYLLGSSYEQ
jgi:glucose-1-phosphate thymidylyltransferase